MLLPVMSGQIERRILVNFRVAPEVLARNLPAPLSPQLVRGQALVGICLIRLKQLRPAGLPRWVGFTSENAAHRAAVTWPEAGKERPGVYVWRRDTNSRINHLAGGRLFPGVHHRAHFEVDDKGDDIRLALSSQDGEIRLAITGKVAQRLPAGSIFASLEEASAFFRAGSSGYSAARRAGRLQGLQLCCRNWRVEPLELTQARSSFFEESARFPKGSAQFDCALVMRRIEHTWKSLPDLKSAE